MLLQFSFKPSIYSSFLYRKLKFAFEWAVWASFWPSWGSKNRVSKITVLPTRNHWGYCCWAIHSHISMYETLPTWTTHLQSILWVRIALLPSRMRLHCFSKLLVSSAISIFIFRVDRVCCYDFSLDPTFRPPFVWARNALPWPLPSKVSTVWPTQPLFQG